MIHMTYTKDGVTSEYTGPDEVADDWVKRADAFFLPAWTPADEMNFRRIMADDEIRRNPEGGRKGSRKAQDRAEGSGRGKGKDRATERT